MKSLSSFRLSGLRHFAFIVVAMLVCAFTSFARPADAQKYVALKGDFWRGYPVDGFTIDTHDNISVTIPAYEMVYFLAPERLTLHSADSIRVWCSVEDGAVLTVGSAIDTNNDLVMGTLKGPLPYGPYVVPFELQTKGPHTYADYIVVTAKRGTSTLDAAELQVPESSVDVPPALVQNERVQWYTFPLGAHVFEGTLEQAIEHLPKPAAYVTSDGKQYVLGR